MSVTSASSAHASPSVKRPVVSEDRVSETRKYRNRVSLELYLSIPVSKVIVTTRLGFPSQQHTAYYLLFFVGRLSKLRNSPNEESTIVNEGLADRIYSPGTPTPQVGLEGWRDARSEEREVLLHVV